MRIVTLSCPECGTIVAANKLEDRRVMHCPGIGCGQVLRFTDVPESDRDHFLSHRDRYRI